jgi:hypothetical protein
MAVEKLLAAKLAKIKLRQEALQSIFSGRLDIFYPPNFGCSERKGSFSTATPDYATDDANHPFDQRPEQCQTLHVRLKRGREIRSCGVYTCLAATFAPPRPFALISHE